MIFPAQSIQPFGFGLVQNGTKSSQSFAVDRNLVVDEDAGYFLPSPAPQDSCFGFVDDKTLFADDIANLIYQFSHMGIFIFG